LQLLSAAKKVAGELMSAAPAGLASSEPLAAEVALVAASKKAFLFASGVAAQKYMDKLRDEQEVVGVLADIVMDTYAAESALLRARKIVSQKGTADVLPVVMTQVFVRDALDRVERNARTALAACAAGDTLRSQLALLRRLLKREPVDAIALRRKVARATIEAGRYPI
jgi:D-arabinose 1-dehydrogenase-like Zn-dependent alcohol dehydrogenase